MNQSDQKKIAVNGASLIGVSGVLTALAGDINELAEALSSKDFERSSMVAMNISDGLSHLGNLLVGALRK